MPSKKSALEKIAGSPITGTAANAVPMAVAAMAGNFELSSIASLLPTLFDTLARDRFDKRIEDELLRIDSQLAQISEQVKEISDNQFGLICKTIQSILETNDEEKLSYLNRVITNSIDIKDITPQETIILGRIIRDISAQELNFIVKNFHYRRIHVTDAQESNDTTLRINRKSPESLIVSGLESIGILVFSIATMGGGNILEFSQITGKLIALIKNFDSQT